MRQRPALGNGIDLVHMAFAEDWAMRPVLEGLCKYESLCDGSLTLSDLARMNEALEVRDENTWRIHQAASKERVNGK